MKRLLKVLVVSMVISTAHLVHAAARGGDQGFGIMLGNPSGLSGKVWLSDKNAIDGALGIESSELDVHVSMLIHDFDFLKRMNIVPASAPYQMPVYYGVGPRFLFEDDTEFGIRLPVGISMFPDQTVWEFFCEFAPVIRLTPDTGMDADFSVGARYYFLGVRPK